MSPIVKTALWVLAAITPLLIATLAILRWDATQQVRAAQSEAERSAQSVGRLVELTVGVAAGRLEALADAPTLEAAIEGDAQAIAQELALVRQDPAWLGLVVVGPDGESLGSVGQITARDLELVPEGGGVSVAPRRGFEAARAIIARPVVVDGREIGWLAGAYSLGALEAVLGRSPDGGMTLLTLPDGTVLLGPTTSIDGQVDFRSDGTQMTARLKGEVLAAAVEPVLEGGARVASVQAPAAFSRGVGWVIAVLVLAQLLLAAVIVLWRDRLVRAHQRLQFRERELAALQELATDATVTANRDKVVRMAGARMAELMPGVDRTWIALTLTGERERVQLYQTYPVVKDPVVVPADGNPIVARVLQHGHREIGELVPIGPSWAAAGFEDGRWECWIPLVAHGRILGAIACLSPGGRADLSIDEQRLLDGLAATLAVAMESHERLSELSQQRAILATVVDASPDGLLALDGANRVVLDNPAARALFLADRPLVGETIPEILERTRARGGNPDFDFDPIRLLEKSRAGTVARGAFRLGSGDGVRAMESIMAPLPLPAGEMGSLVAMRDVSERAELEEVRHLHGQVTELAREAAGRAALLEQVLAASDVGMAFLDDGGRVVYANQLFAELLGMRAPPRGIDEKELEELVRERVEGEFVDLRTAALLHTAPPARRIIAMRSVEVRRSPEQNVGRLVSLRDETAQRELEEARESFIGVAAHELKNPLAVLRVQAELGVRDERRAPDALHRILLRTRQLQELVDRLLDATRAELGRLSIQREEVQALHLVCEALEPFFAQSEQLHVEGDETLTVSVDPVRFKQVVSNLVSNALRYGGEGRVDVSVRRADDSITVAVQDRGPGIPREEQRQIFERFGQGRSASKGPGLGIGLYLARRIVEAHGGTIELRSEPGAGSTFTVVLPAPGPEEPARYGAGDIMQASTKP